MPPDGIRTHIPARERPQTQALDRVTTGILSSSQYEIAQRRPFTSWEGEHVCFWLRNLVGKGWENTLRCAPQWGSVFRKASRLVGRSVYFSTQSFQNQRRRHSGLDTVAWPPLPTRTSIDHWEVGNRAVGWLISEHSELWAESSLFGIPWMNNIMGDDKKEPQPQFCPAILPSLLIVASPGTKRFSAASRASSLHWLYRNYSFISASWLFQCEVTSINLGPRMIRVFLFVRFWYTWELHLTPGCWAFGSNYCTVLFIWETGEFLEKISQVWHRKPLAVKRHTDNKWFLIYEGRSEDKFTLHVYWVLYCICNKNSSDWSVLLHHDFTT